jgi:eukaryotic-like serine/threonine-protein kinase
LRYSVVAVSEENTLDAEGTLAPGKQLGRYQIVRLLGRGGMGSVYEALHRDLKKRVAIKTLHPSVAATPGALARFLREGEAASRIRHPNVVDVTDVATDDGVAYLVMEFLEGEDLAQRLARSGRLSFSESVDIMLPVLGAISVAHDEGVIHRDLKPENIFLTRTRHGGSEPKLLDFGISKLTSSGGGNTLALTGTGASMGTPYYIAPEQVRSATGVDARSDQYALGAILYECITGQRAHQGETLYEVIRSVGEGSFPTPRSLRPETPPELEEAILCAMQLDPARRFQSVQAFGRALLRFASPAARKQWAPALTGDSGVARPSHPNPPASQPGRTVILPTPVPGDAGGDGVGPRSRSTPPAANTTFGSSAAQLTLPARNRSGLLVGGLVALAAAAIVAYVVTSPSSRHQKKESHATSTEDPQTVTAAASRAPASYHVSVTARPREAQLDLDGKGMGTGSLDQELEADGTEHALIVTAAGFVPTRLTFRDRPPPERVTLEPLAAAPVKPIEATAVPAHSSKSKVGAHERDGAHQHLHARTVSKPAATIRTENNAPIIDD